MLKGSIDGDPRAIEEQGRGLGDFVLATEHLDQGKVSDLEILEWYKEQEQEEGSFSWFKGPAALAPIFLKKSQGILALGMVFLLARSVLRQAELVINK